MAQTIFAIIQIIQAGFTNTCISNECRRTASLMLQNRDITQDHCLNFYEYACANYRTTHPASASGVNRGLYAMQNQHLNDKIAEILDIEDPTALPVVQRARALYRNCRTTSSQLTAPIDCAAFIKEQYPRVVLYLLATPEVYAQREKIRVMMAQIKLTFITTIQNSWLDNDKKAAVIEKLNNLHLVIGFTPDMIQENNLQAPYEDPYILFGTSSAFYPEENAIMVPIADFFFPSHNLGLEVLHFATLGFTVAHEMSHTYDMGIRVGNWWSMRMQNIYMEKAQCLVQQFNQFPVEGHQIGQLTLAENMADNVGFKLSLNAYRMFRRFRGRPEKKLIRFESYSHEKLFMLAFANKWCEHVPPHVHMTDAMSGHAPAPIRVNGVIMNSPDFGNLWNCPLNSRMNPVHKCNIFDP